MPRIKVKRLQKGGNLTFLVDNNKFDLDEQSMDANINAFIDSDVRLKKSKNAILSEYNATKNRLREGANSGKLMNIDTSDKGVVGISSNDELTDAQRGLTNKGAVAKPGLFSNLTGVKDEAVISGAVNKFIGDSLFNAHSTYTKEQTTLKEKQDAENAALEIRNQEALKAEKQKTHDSVLRNLDLGSSLYGAQLGEAAASAEQNYARYHTDKKKQRETDLAYLNALKSTFNSEGVVNNPEFANSFLERTKGQYGDFKSKLDAIDTTDSKLDIQKAMDSIGLGSQYSMLRNPKLITKPTTQGQTSTEVSDEEPVNQGAPTADLAPDPYVEQEGDQVPQGATQLDTPESILNRQYSSTDSPSTLKFGSVLVENGKEYPVSEYKKLYEQGKVKNVEYYNIANQFLTKYKQVSDEYSNDPSLNWENFNGRSLNEYQTPYKSDSYDLKNVDKFLQLTNVFSKAKNKNGTYDFGVVEERTKNGEIRTRYIDKTGEYLGYYKVGADGKARFEAIDRNGKRFKSFDLGNVTTDQELGNKSVGRTLTYSWKAQKGKPKEVTTMDKISIALNPLNLLKFQAGGSIPTDYRSSAKTKADTRGTSAVNATTIVKSLLGNQDYKLSEADELDLTSFILDAGSLGLSFVPGASLGSAAAGIGSTSAAWRASQLRGEEMSPTSLAMSYGLDVATAIPVLGGLAKAGKLGKNGVRGIRVLQNIAKIAGATALYSSLGKALDGDISVGNLQAITSGIAALRAGKNASLKKATTVDPNAISKVSLKGANGQTVINLDQSQANAFKGKLTNKRQLDFIKPIAKEQGVNVDGLKLDGNKSFGYSNAFGLGKKQRLAENNTSRSNSGIVFRDMIGDTKGATRGRRLLTEEEAKDATGLMSKAKSFFTFGGSQTPSAAVKQYGIDNAAIKPLSVPESKVIPPGTPNTGKSNTKSVETRPSSSFGDKVEVAKAKLDGMRASFLNIQARAPKEAMVSKTRQNLVNDLGNSINSVPSKIQSNAYQGKVQMATAATDGAKDVVQVANPFTKAPKAEVNATSDKKASVNREKSTDQSKTKISKNNDNNRKVNNSKMSKVNKKAGKGQLGMKLTPLNGISFGAKKNPFNTFSTAYNNTANKLKTSTSPFTGVKPLTLGSGFKTSSIATSNPILNGSTATGSVGKMTFTDPRKTMKISANPLDISEGLRALYNVNTTSKIDTRVEAPILSNTLEVAPSIKSNIGLTTAYDNAGNRLRQGAGTPMYNDAGLQVARQLSADAKASEFELQGRVQNASDIQAQTGRAEDLARQYAANRTAVANQNASTIANKIQAERGLNNEKKVAIAKSFDNFWANSNMKGYQNQRQRMGLESAKQEIEAGDAKLGVNDMGLNPESTVNATLAQLQNDTSALAMKEYNGLPMSADEVARLTSSRNQINQLTKKLQKSGIQRSLDLLGGKKDLFSFKVGPRASITGPAVTSYRKAGGKMTFDQRKELQAMKINAKVESDWVKTYNNWMKSKVDSDNKMLSESRKSTNAFISKMYDNK